MTMVKNVYENCNPMERILTLLQLVKTRPPRASIHNAPRKLVLFLLNQKQEEREVGIEGRVQMVSNGAYKYSTSSIRNGILKGLNPSPNRRSVRSQEVVRPDKQRCNRL